MADELTITLRIQRAADPHLYRELVRYAKGPARVNRLRALAREGLNQFADPQRGLAPAAPTAESDETVQHAAGVQLFDRNE